MAHVLETSAHGTKTFNRHAPFRSCRQCSSRATRPPKSRRLCTWASSDSQDKPLVVVGSVNADLVLQVDRLPKSGETMAAKSLQTFPGGKGANQAAAAGKLGTKTFFLGQVGQDANAEFLQSSLQSAGVDLSHLRTVEGPSGTAVILLQPSGENSIVIVGGANTAGWAIESSSRQLLQSAAAVLLQREIPEEINAEVAEVAAAAGVRVVLDCGGMEGPIDPQLLKNVHILSPNETELARLTELPTESKEDVTAAAQQLLQRGVRGAVLVKRGGSGCLLVTHDGVTEQGVFKADKVVDTTGAGDCFTGAYAVALLEGLEGKEALQFAAAAASICVQREGAMTSLPTRTEVDQLLHQGT